MEPWALREGGVQGERPLSWGLDWAPQVRPWRFEGPGREGLEAQAGVSWSDWGEVWDSVRTIESLCDSPALCVGV